jgi:ATP-dependent Clp protease ATP-binding subunit ClpA
MKISHELQAVFNLAFEEAKSRRSEYLTPEHLLLCSLQFDSQVKLIEACGGEVKVIRDLLDAYLSK